MQRPWLLALVALGCGSEALDGGADQAPAPLECEAPGYPTDAEPAFVGSVEATVLDLEGNAPAELLVQVCGLDLCISGETDADGYSTVAVESEMKLPAFKYGDGLTHGKVALLLEPPTDAVDLGEVRLPALPAAGAAITAGSVAASAGVELAPAENAAITFDRLTYRSADEQAFRAAELPVALAPTGLDGGLGLELLFALAPIDTEFCPPAALSVPNSAGWDAGTEVEFYLHGLDIEERHAPYGGFAKIADGAVSEDGSSVKTSSGGLPLLSLVGVKRK